MSLAAAEAQIEEAVEATAEELAEIAKHAQHALVGMRYGADNVQNMKNIWRHFTTRGHKGPIMAIVVSSWAEFIVTGGVDYSLRVWQFNARFEAYDLVAITQMEVPPSLRDQSKISLKQWLYNLVMPPKADWDKILQGKKRGVTAICCTSVPHDHYSKLLRNGPILSGNNHGDLYFTDLLRETTSAAEPLWKLHEGVIHDITFVVETAKKATTTKLENGETRHQSATADLLAMTGSGDGTAKLIRIKCQEVEEGPSFFQHTTIDPQGFWATTADALFRGGGGRKEARAAREAEEESWRAGNGIKTSDEPWLTMLGRPEVVATCKHDKPVLAVKPLKANGKGRASFVSLCEDYVALWDCDGKPVTRLFMHGKKLPWWDGSELERPHDMCEMTFSKLTGCASVVKPKGSLLFVSGMNPETGRTGVAVWGFEHGLVGVKGRQNKHGEEMGGSLDYDEDHCKSLMKKTPEPGILEPLCVYTQPGSLLDIDQAGVSTTFAVQLLEDKETVNVWDLEAVEPGRLVLEPEGPASLLLCPGSEKSLVQLKHLSKVHDMRVVEDTEGPALVTGCDDGTGFIWDLEGDDSGQCYGELRSMAALEILVPIIMLFVTFSQVFSFAFGPAVKWKKEVHSHAVVAHKIMLLDFKQTIKIDKETIFWPEMTVILGLILLFQIFAIVDLPHQLDATVRGVQDLANRQGGCLKAMRPVLKFVAEKSRSLVYLMMQLLSTVLVVPMVQSCAQAVDCVWDENLTALDVLQGNYTTEQLHLGDVPTVKCYEGAHLHLALCVWFLVPLYLVFLLPYAVCAGDAQYINSKALWDFKVWKKENAWRLAAKRKATDMHLGFLHPNPPQAFLTLTIDLWSKVMLPVLTTWTTHRPLFQMCGVSCIGFVLWYSSIARAPYVERKWCVLVQDLKLITVLAMCCGVLTVYVNDSSSSLSITVLGTSIVSVLVGLGLKFLCDTEANLERPLVKVWDHDRHATPANAATDEEAARPLLQEDAQADVRELQARKAEEGAPNVE